MSLLSSILNFAFVVGAGWFVIYYLVPKFESGELGLGGLSYPTGQGGAEGSPLEEQVIPSDITDAALGDEPGTTEGMVEEEAAPKTEETKKGKQKKGKGEWLSSDKAGKDNRKQKKKSKAEMRIMEYLGDYYGLY